MQEKASVTEYALLPLALAVTFSPAKYMWCSLIYRFSPQNQSAEKELYLKNIHFFLKCSFFSIYKKLIF